jgi:MSHA biogenesis protein MshG
MSDFRYRGRSGRGELVTGRLEADDVDAVAGRLLNLGITPLDISPVAADGLSVRDFLRRLGAGRPTASDLVLFSRQMYSVTKSGLPLLRGLRGLAQSTHNSVLRDALHDVLQSLESGRDLASSLARHPDIFSPLFVSMVRVGESTGTLDNSFARLCEYLGHDQDVHDRVKSAVRYPLIVVAAIAVAVAIITVFVIPNFAPLFKILGNDIPWPTRVIMAPPISCAITAPRSSRPPPSDRSRSGGTSARSPDATNGTASSSRCRCSASFCTSRCCRG